MGLVTETPDVTASNVLFIHSSSSLGVKEDNLRIPYWQRAYVKAVRPRLVLRGAAPDNFAAPATVPPLPAPASVGGAVLEQVQQILKPE